MRLLYRPFKLVGVMIAAKLGRGIFTSVWSRIDDAPPPTATTPDTTWGKVIGAAALRGATMATMAAAADRAGAHVFEYLTGAWPGKDPDKEKKKRSER
jgi:hypothetical protein